jgi:hypothetical protein
VSCLSPPTSLARRTIDQSIAIANAPKNAPEERKRKIFPDVNATSIDQQ